MSQWRASQVSTDSGRHSTAEDLVLKVKELIEQPKFSLGVANRVPYGEETQRYSQILASLSDMLSQFPRVNGSATTQDAQLAFLCLDAIERISQRMEGSLARYERDFTRKLLICSAAMEGWVQKDGVDLQDAEVLRDRTSQVLTNTLQLLLREASATGKKFEEGTFEVIECLVGMNSALHVISTRDTADYPLTIDALKAPPDHISSQSIQTVDQGIHLLNPDHAYGFALNILLIITTVLQRSSTIPFLVPQILPECLESTSALFSVLSKSPSQKIYNHLFRLLSVAKILSQIAPQSFKLVQPALFKLLAARLGRGPNASWDTVDDLLASLLSQTIQDSVLTANIADHLLQVSSDAEDQENLASALYAYMAHYATRCSPTSLSSLQVPPISNDSSLAIQTLRNVIQSRSSASRPHSNGINGHNGDWREQSIQKILNGLFKELNIQEFDQDQMEVDGENWQIGLMQELQAHFNSAPLALSAEGRIAVARRLAELPYELLGGGKHADSTDLKLPFAQLYAAATMRLLEGSPKNVTVEVQRLTYSAFAEGLRHHSMQDDDIQRLNIGETINKGLVHKHRLVRLSAGRLFAEFWKLLQEAERGAQEHGDMLLQGLAALIKQRGDHIKETSMVTLGSIGRLAPANKLPPISFLLVGELGNTNPVLRGVAFQQLSILAQKEKSPYNLVAPDMSRIALHIASNCVKQPLLLSEFCQFISYSPSSFLSQTILDYLPELVARCAEDELLAIAKLMDTPLAALVIEKPAEVLERVFLLNGDAETDKALDFVLRSLPGGTTSSQTNLGIATLVKSTAISLLGRLVIQLGTEDAVTQKQVMTAIGKVGKYTTDSTHSPEVLLQQHIMGVVSHLNHELQEEYGKRSIDSKCKVLHGITQVIKRIGQPIAIVAPQLVAIMQNSVHQEGLVTCTIEAWYTLAKILKPEDFIPYLALTSAVFADSWPRFDKRAKQMAKRTISLIVSGPAFHDHLTLLASFEGIEELKSEQHDITSTNPNLPIDQKLELLSSRILDVNATVSQLAIIEATKLISNHKAFYPLIEGDVFNPAVGHLIKALHTVAGREGEAYDSTRSAAFRCLGIIGAIDPDRFEIPRDNENPKIIFCDFDDDLHALNFAIHLITHILTPIFPKTSDIKFQSQLAYTIQELLLFCGFSESLIITEQRNPVSAKARGLWSRIPGEVRATIAPLLSSKYSIEGRIDIPTVHPIYPSMSTYKEWIQKFSSYLISQVRGKNVPRIFQPFRALLGSADVQVLIFLLPYLVLEILSDDSPEGFSRIRDEIIAVVEDQVNPQPNHSNDMRLLCAQMIFHLMDHLNKYLRYARMSHGKRGKTSSLQSRYRIVEKLTTSIDHSLMSGAAYNCKQYARALMSLEQRVMQGSIKNILDEATLQDCYEQMHKIYANLDEPDGMNGISSKVLSPSIEHQIREHESIGRWTSAQSCWEVSLQQDPNNLDSQVGLLRCLRNLGHFDTMRTHLAGVLTRNPEWSETLEPFTLEGAWTANDWRTVQRIVDSSQIHSPELGIGKLLLALRSGDETVIETALSSARYEFGQPIGGGGAHSYRRTYEASVYLHMVEELATISRTVIEASRGRRSGQESKLSGLSRWLNDRYDSVLPSYRTLEPILSIRRTALDLLNHKFDSINTLVGHYWLVSSKIARKAGHLQAAYSALLQGRHRGAPYHFIQGCKLLQRNGETIRALQELNNALVLKNDAHTGFIDLTEPDEDRLDRAKAWLLRARWMETSERFSRVELNAQFSHAAQLYEEWESSYFHWALYLDRSQVHKDIPGNQLEEYVNHIDHVVRNYGKSLKHGSKHLYQTVPRMLTLWLNLGQRNELQTQKGVSTAEHAYRAALTKFGRLCEWIREDLVENVDPFKWLIAFPQIVSRLLNESVVLSKAIYTIVGKVVQEFPQQSLWIITGVSSSKKKERREAAARALGYIFNEKFYGKGLDAKRKTQVAATMELIRPLAGVYSAMNSELLNLCNFEVGNIELHSLAHKFPKLWDMKLWDVIVPLQSSFTTKIPPVSSQNLLNQSFPHSLPTIKRFLDDIQVMASLQKPRKIGIEASNGEYYYFLCKPKDDLRKDARLMDFNSVVNKLLRANSESRRRQLRTRDLEAQKHANVASIDIRTYSVVPLNEECGLIEWVRNTIAFRNLLKPRYDAAGILMMPKRVTEYFDKMKGMSGDQAAKTFDERILAEFKPLFHEWFLETFPEPTAWFASRLNYSRTAAVISMVGYIIGLGDRHCENIMLDEGTGETVHCDFNCLFDKGKQFEVPEVVPFRLTQNIVDGMGITGVEGPFRISCEITMQLLRSNQDCLMSVLEAFIHDPLVEWEDAHRRRGRREVVSSTDLRQLALNALNPIEKKLQGMEAEKQISVSNQVDKLIQEATSLQKLAKMYVGWTPWV